MTFDVEVASQNSPLAKVVLTLVTLLFATVQPWRKLDHFESFSGGFNGMSVTAGELGENRKGLPLDLELDGDTMNIMTPHGFSNALWAVCQLKIGGGKFTAPVCSTWVYLSGAQPLQTHVFYEF